MSGKPLHPTLGPLSSPTMGVQARGMMVGRALSAVLRSPQPGRRQEPLALCWSWGRESPAPVCAQMVFAPSHVLGPSVCPTQPRKATQPCGHGGTGCPLKAAGSIWGRRNAGRTETALVVTSVADGPREGAAPGVI